MLNAYHINRYVVLCFLIVNFCFLLKGHKAGLFPFHKDTKTHKKDTNNKRKALRVKNLYSKMRFVSLFPYGYRNIFFEDFINEYSRQI
jgi:hypothetical protein